MFPDECGRDLHLRAARGEALGQAERGQLNAWYEHLEVQQGLQLAELPLDPNIAEIQVRIDLALGRIMGLAKRIQEIESQNAALRGQVEIEECRHTAKVAADSV